MGDGLLEMFGNYGNYLQNVIPVASIEKTCNQISSDRDEIFGVLRVAPPDFQKGMVPHVQMTNSAFSPRISPAHDRAAAG